MQTKDGLSHLQQKEAGGQSNSADNLQYYNISPADLAYGGIWYPVDWQLKIRSATYAEIKHWSNIVVSNPMDVRDHMQQIISSCCIGHEILLDIDRLTVLLHIQNITMGKDNPLLVSWSGLAELFRDQPRPDDVAFAPTDDFLHQFIGDDGWAVIEHAALAKPIKIRPITGKVADSLARWGSSKGAAWLKRNRQWLDFLAITLERPLKADQYQKALSNLQKAVTNAEQLAVWHHCYDSISQYRQEPALQRSTEDGRELTAELEMSQFKVFFRKSIVTGFQSAKQQNPE